MSRRSLKLAARADAPLRFILADELKADAGVVVRDLDPSGTFVRPPAREVLDLSGQDIVHPLGGAITQQLSAKAWIGLPSGTEVRGSMLLRLRDGRLHLPRQGGHDDTWGFLGYLKDLPDAPAEARYHSGLRWLEDGTPELDPAPVVTLPGEAVWVTADEPYNYGVWLLQVLPAVARAEAEGFEGVLLCHAPTAWQQAILRTVAPKLARRLVQHDLSRTYRATGRLWTVAQDRRNFVVTPSEAEVFDRLIDAALAEETAPTPERLYVSRLARSRAAPGYRTLLNEEALAEAMAAEGFTVVEPETLPFAKQIALFARAETVVGPGGAGLFNAVFQRAGTRVMTIESSAFWIEAHANIFASRGLDYAVVFGRQEMDDDGPQKRWSVAVEPTMDLVRRFPA